MKLHSVVRCFHSYLFAFAFLWSAIWSVDASGQVNIIGMNRLGMASLVDPPRTVRRVLSEAEKAIAEQRYSDAVVRIGDFLQRDVEELGDTQGVQDYFLDINQRSANGGSQQSLFRTMRLLIQKLPAPARETYELRYGPNAKRLLEQATQQLDWHRLADVRRRFFYTRAGQQATVILARRAWQMGRALECSHLLEDVVAFESVDSVIDEDVRRLYVLSSVASGRPLPKKFSLSLPADEVSDGASSAGQGDSVKTLAGSELETWAEGQISLGPLRGARQSHDTTMLGERPDRNGGSSGQMPLARPEWIVDTTASPRATELLIDESVQLRAQGGLAPLSTQPLRVGDQVLVRTTKWLIGVDFETGKIVWTYPWFSAHETMDDTELVTASVERDQEVVELVERVWNDLPYGQMTSDGERLFLLDGLDTTEAFRMGSNMGGRRFRTEAANTLVALELSTQGKLLWRLGADEDQASPLGEAFFLGPPLPVDGRLYVLAELAGDLSVYCLDPTTGRELWHQVIGSANGSQAKFDRRRRMAGAMLSYHQGLLICPTGNGLVVAIDLVDRCLRWSRSYLRTDKLNVNQMQSNAISQADLMRRWTDGKAIADGNRLILTPIESDKLMVMDVSTGKSVIRDRDREKSLYVAGVRDGYMVLVEGRKVSSVSVNDGSVRWSTPANLFKGDQQVSGRGVFGENSFFVPTSSNELLELSLEDGRLMNSKKMDYPLGNLIATGGEFFSQSPTELVFAAGMTSLRPIVDQRLLDDPDDLNALIDRAKLWLESDRRRDAIDLLHRAEGIAPEDIEVSDLLVAAMLDEVRVSDQLEMDFLSELEARIVQPEQRIKFYRLQVQAFIRNRRPVDAIKTITTLSDGLLRQEDQGANDEWMTFPGREVRPSDWLAGRVSEAISIASDEDRRTIESIVKSHLDRHENDSLSDLSDLLVQFSCAESADALRRLVFARLQEIASPTELERLALGRHSRSDLQDLSSDRLKMLAFAYSKAQMPEDTVEVLGILDRRNEATDSEPSDRASAAAESQEPESTAGGDGPIENSVVPEGQWDSESPPVLGVSMPSPESWPTSLTIDFASSRNASSPLLQRNMPLRFVQTRRLSQLGSHFRGLEFGASDRRPLVIRNHLGRTRVAPIQANPMRRGGVQESLISGSLAVLGLGNEILGLNLASSAGSMDPVQRWRREIGGGDESITAIHKYNLLKEKVYRNRIPDRGLVDGTLAEISLGPLLGDRFMMLQDRELICLDALSGEPKWRNLGAPRSGVVVANDTQVAVISDEGGEITYFSLFDGKKIRSVPWDFGEVWGRSGRMVLALRREVPTPAPLQCGIRLVDPFAADLVQLEHVTLPFHSVHTKTLGNLVDQRWMTLLDREGHLIIWDIDSGRVVFDDVLDDVLSTKDDGPALIGLEVMLTAEKLLVLPNYQQLGGAPPVSSQSKIRYRAMDNQVEANAVIAIDMETGEIAWEQRFVQPWGVTLDQPLSTPIVLMTRGLTSFRTTGKREQKIDVRVLDVRDGGTLAEVLGQEVGSSFTFRDAEVTLTPLESVKAVIDTQILTFKFGQGNE